MSDVTAKADRCKRLLEDPDLLQAFDDVENAIFERFKQVSIGDRETLNELKITQHLLLSLKANLERAISDGELEVFRLEQDERLPVLGDLLAWKRNRALKTGS